VAVVDQSTVVRDKKQEPTVGDPFGETHDDLCRWRVDPLSIVDNDQERDLGGNRVKRKRHVRRELSLLTFVVTAERIDADIRCGLQTYCG